MATNLLQPVNGQQAEVLPNEPKTTPKCETESHWVLLLKYKHLSATKAHSCCNPSPGQGSLLKYT